MHEQQNSERQEKETTTEIRDTEGKKFFAVIVNGRNRLKCSARTPRSSNVLNTSHAALDAPTRMLFETLRGLFQTTGSSKSSSNALWHRLLTSMTPSFSSYDHKTI